MKLTTGIVAMAMMAGGMWSQNPSAIDNARNTVKSLQQQQAAKPAPGAPAPAVKAAAIPGAKAAAPAPKPAASAPGQTNKLQHVNVVPGANDIQIEISSTHAVTPRVTNLSSPARLLVELPETVVASSQNKIPVGSAGVKGVRIGMDGKTPPTTSVVVDLEKALPYEIAPGPAGKTVLILHTQDAGAAVAKSTPPAPGKSAAPLAKTQAPAKPVAAPKVADAKAPAAKPVAVAKVADAKAPAAKPAAAPVKADAKQPAKTVVAAKPAPAIPAPVKVAEAPKQPKPEEKKWAMSGKRDPFFSPVVQQSGSGCATGKKCLEIGAINLRGVVKSDSGFIAVVTNNLNKAYFLRENDPVFNGYVVKITGDSVVFQETIQDKLGKSFTREVVKRIMAPAV
ncbi:MAG TPA: AMIN domain-containing protein [Candidatus Sulfotelmatobacter sp.]|nr:AMIN domain-containing protein [Candidatus Sulfotelmatobacter sp.]